MALREAPSLRRLRAPSSAGRKVLGTDNDETAGGRAPAQRPPQVLRHVQEIWERQPAPCHARLQCRSIPSVGEWEDTQKHTNPKIRGWRPEHLP